jgi:hypothetical protein
MLNMLVVAAAALAPGESRAQPNPASPETVAWFQATEQRLFGTLAHGDKTPWEEILDPSCVYTSEEGQVLSREQLLAEIRPLSAGLVGDITVRELTVQEFPAFAIVRFLADEWEAVFGQRLTTRYRVTDTFRRDGKAWKLVASHLSVVTADPPEQSVSKAAWPSLAGRYRLVPDGWTFTVELRDGKLYGGRESNELRPLIPLTANAFVLSGSLGEWLFVTDESGRATRIVSYRKFGPLVWERVE